NPSRYDMNTSRSPAPQRRPRPPGLRRMRSTGLPLVQTDVASMSLSSPSRFVPAIMIAHGDSASASGERGVPPAPGCRRNAILLPSGDQTGDESREVDGATYRIGRPGTKSAMKL